MIHIAESPFVVAGSSDVRRLVIKDDGNQIIVHKQYADADGRTSYEYGRYFNYKHGHLAGNRPEAIRLAWADFKQRAEDDMASYPIADMEADPERFRQFLPGAAVI